MSWTESDITKLERAIASGVLTVRYGDQTTTFQSLDAMRAALAQMRREFAEANGTAGASTRIMVSAGKGL